MRSVKQFKLIGGEEILCDLVGVELDEYDAEVMIIRGAYSLISQEDFENGLRYYTFRPFMMHINDPSHLLALNSGSIICMTTPSETVEEQYIKYIGLHTKEEDKDDSIGEYEEDLSDENIIKFNPKLH